MKLLRLIMAAVLILASGVGGGVWAVHSAWAGASGETVVWNDHWETDPTFGSASSDDRTRAHLALVGLLGLPREEAIYYIRSRTADGQAIDSDGIYELRGRGDLPGR